MNNKEQIYRSVLSSCNGAFTLLINASDQRRLPEWLLSAFIIWNEQRAIPASFPVGLNPNLLEFLFREMFPFSEVDLSKRLRGIEPFPDNQFIQQVGFDPSNDLLSGTDKEGNAPPNPDVRLIAFYLPQFHQIPENDQWWGEGFTEWTNVRRGVPSYKFHDQPRVPTELGYYNLTESQVQQRQSELARQYGVFGFCYYYYWFNRDKKLLEKPLQQILRSGLPDFPFCVCWANENWTRRWDGFDNQILVRQEYVPGDLRQFIDELIPIFSDHRYIKINKRPLLVIYRPADIPEPRRTFAEWRSAARSNGFPDLYIAGVQAFGFTNPEPYGIDAAIEFPTHFRVNASTQSHLKVAGLSPSFPGLILSHYLNRYYSTSRQKPIYKLFKGVTPMWDNTPRRLEKATVLETLGLVPENYFAWLSHSVEYTRRMFDGDERLVFINAWNEWGEGCYLEPDKTYGRALLRATRDAVAAKTTIPHIERIPNNVRREDPLEVVFVSHDAARAGAQISLLTLIHWLRDAKHIVPKILLRKGGILVDEFHKLGPVLEVESLLDSGGDRLFTAISQFCGSSSLAYINTLVPGDLAGIFSRLQIPIVTHVHEMQRAIERWCDPEALKQLLKASMYFVAASPPVASNLEERHGIPASRIGTVYEFINCDSDTNDVTKRLNIRKEKGLNSDGSIIFGCGTTDWRKGPDLFVEIANRIHCAGARKFHFYWLGGYIDIQESATLKKQIRDLGLEEYVTFLGEVADPRSYFRGGDIFLLTSREDPYPLACLEAADCELPIVCFKDAGGMPDFVEDDAGYVVPFEDVGAAAEQVIILCDDAELRLRMGVCAREKVRQRHDVVVSGERIYRIIERCARENNDRKVIGFVPQSSRLSRGVRPKVSVIVPNYNHAPYLSRRMDSILNQEIQDLEVIVLDDASTDSSRDILRQYENHPKCRFFFSPTNGGTVTGQWQRGLNEARGDFVWFAESDDYASPYFLQRLLAILERNPSLGLAYCQSYLVDRENRLLGDGTVWTDDLDVQRWRRDFINGGRDETRRFLSQKNTIPNASAVLARASTLKAVGTINGAYRLCGDWDVWIKVLLRSDVAFIAEKLNYWRQDSSNVRTVPAGVLEAEEGERILRFLGDNLNLSEFEISQMIASFRGRCHEWQKASVNVNHVKQPQ